MRTFKSIAERSCEQAFVPECTIDEVKAFSNGFVEVSTPYNIGDPSDGENTMRVARKEILARPDAVQRPTQFASLEVACIMCTLESKKRRTRTANSAEPIKQRHATGDNGKEGCNSTFPWVCQSCGWHGDHGNAQNCKTLIHLNQHRKHSDGSDESS